jgi:dihydroorotase
MNKRILLKNAKIVNEGSIFDGDLLIINDRIEKIATHISDSNAQIIDCQGLYLMPGCIDDQVHFREPGLTHKATIHSESRAAVAGGITTFMEMPNTKPATLTHALLEDKYHIASKSSIANYSFYMGTSNENYDDLMRIDYSKVCGLKIFMGSSTGNLLVDNRNTLEKIFSNFPHLIATHCEDEKTILDNTDIYKKLNSVDASFHPKIRSREACYLSSSFAVNLASQHKTRLHILHISTKDEVNLFTNQIPLKDKKITAEACVHHLFFNDADYKSLGNKIKCNPAIKTKEDAFQIAKALADNKIDVVATDHAPHTLQEKNQNYWDAPSGLPLVQHALSMMNTLAVHQNWSIEFIVEKMCHNPAICFKIKDRGFIREGYYADLVLFDPNSNNVIKSHELLYQCAWSPLENKVLQGNVKLTFVNGICVYDAGKIIEGSIGSRLEFHN